MIIQIVVPITGRSMATDGGLKGDPNNPPRPPSGDELIAMVTPAAIRNRPASGVGESFRVRTKTLSYDLDTGECEIEIECDDVAWLTSITTALAGKSISQKRAALNMGALQRGG